MLGELEDTFQAFEQADDLEKLRDILLRAVGKIGFSHFAYRGTGLGEDRRPVVLTNYPLGWTEHYFHKRYFDIDPVISAAETALLPFDWRALSSDRPLSRRQRVLFDEATEFRILGGGTVPIHGPGQNFATLTLTTELPQQEAARLFVHHRHEAHLIGIYAHARIRDLLSRGEIIQEVRISPRERECLLWSARGKTAWEISEILGISEETVVSYLKSVMSKLGVYNKHHAIALAVIKGLIHP